jgi:hypothetical protein
MFQRNSENSRLQDLDSAVLSGEQPTTSPTLWTLMMRYLGVAMVFAALAAPTPSWAAASYPYACGNPSPDNDIFSSDAFSILRASVELWDCPVCICDLDGNGTVFASDALEALRIAVGISGTLNCSEDLDVCTPCGDIADTQKILDRLNDIPADNLVINGNDIGSPILWQCPNSSIIPIDATVWDVVDVSESDRLVSGALRDLSGGLIDKDLTFSLSPACSTCETGDSFLESTATGFRLDHLEIRGFKKGLTLEYAAEVEGVTFTRQCETGIEAVASSHVGTVIKDTTFRQQECGACAAFFSGASIGSQCVGEACWHAQFISSSFSGCQVPFLLTGEDSQFNFRPEGTGSCEAKSGVDCVFDSDCADSCDQSGFCVVDATKSCVQDSDCADWCVPVLGQCEFNNKEDCTTNGDCATGESEGDFCVDGYCDPVLPMACSQTEDCDIDTLTVGWCAIDAVDRWSIAPAQACSEEPDTVCSTNADCTGTCEIFSCEAPKLNYSAFGLTNLVNADVTGCKDGLDVYSANVVDLSRSAFSGNRQSGINGFGATVINGFNSSIVGNGAGSGAISGLGGGVVHREDTPAPGPTPRNTAQFKFGASETRRQNCVHQNLAASGAPVEVRYENVAGTTKMQFVWVWWGEDLEGEEPPLAGSISLIETGGNPEHKLSGPPILGCP